MIDPDAASFFQICGSCRRRWRSWNDFVLDPAVRLLGMQVQTDRSDINLLVFEHDCGTSISILTRRLSGLLSDQDDAQPSVSLRDTERCKGHCRVLGDFASCDAPCINARDRELMRLILRIQRHARAAENDATQSA